MEESTLGCKLLAPEYGAPEDDEARLRWKLERSIFDVCKRSPEGCDFLVSAFVQAMHSYRRSSVCTPFPNALFTTSDDFKEKDFAAAAAAVQSFPPLQDIRSSWIFRDHNSSSVEDETLKPGNTDLSRDSSGSALSCLYTVDKMSLNALKLLDWILRFRHPIELVQDPASDLSGLFPPASSPWASYRKEVAAEACVIPDYVMKVHESDENSRRRRASTFDEVKAESGSFYAFHGTLAENLHSILRCGLLNMSNSQLQRNGCMFGAGIYLSTDPAVAYSFCKAGTGWTHSFCGTRVKYLLVCEVAGRHTLRSEVATTTGSYTTEDNPSAIQGDAVPSTYVLLKNSDLVKIRYVFVYTEPSRVHITLCSSSFGPPEIHPEVSGTHHVARPKFGFTDVFKGVDWCKVLIILYIAVLIGVGLLKHGTRRHGRGSLVRHFWPVYQ